MLRCSFQWCRRIFPNLSVSKVEKSVKRSIAFTIDLICMINCVQSFVCTSTLIEKTLKENQFVGESKYPTASLIFAQFHSPKTERMKKELILTACISSFDETTRNDRKSCPAQRGIAFASMTLLDTNNKP